MARRLPPILEALDPSVRDLAALGVAVRNARGRSQLRIDDAAAFCGVSADLLSRLENGRPVTTDRLLKVLAGMGLDLLVVSRTQAWDLQAAQNPASQVTE